jgi:hypothetical protein
MVRAAAFVWFLVCLARAADPYTASIEAWRHDREAKLKAPDGWLAVAGLFWLKEGENRAGTDPAYEIVLPAGRAPARIGVFDLRNGAVSFRVASQAPVRLHNRTVVAAVLRPDRDQLQIGDITLFVIKRGGRLGVRMRDTQSAMRREFTGLKWYPVKESHRVTAKFTAAPAEIPIPNVLGQTELQPSPGYATFRLNGQTLRLHPVREGDQLFFIFRDLTSGKSTYGAGRFLYADLPKDGQVVLDFNKAYNPPCAFTPYATCPLPPKQNRLAVRIEAGELTYGNH